MPTPSLLLVPARFKTGRLYSQIPTANGDFTVTRDTTARRFDSAGLVASVASGIPRLDYYTSGGVTGCPALLVEPAATNLCRYSEQFDTVTSGWTSTGLQTITGNTNATLDPAGGNTADLIVGTSGLASHQLQASTNNFPSFVSGTTYTFSTFAKATSAASGFIQFLFGGITFSPAGPYANFQLSGNGAVTTGTYSAASIQPFGNGWYRCSFTVIAAAAGTANFFIQPILTSGVARNDTFVGNGVDGVYLWGAQLETGSVATSYIPTTTGTGSRSADVVSVSGAVSGSIGQTEGTIYWEGAIYRYDRVFFALSSGTSTSQAVRLQTTGGGLLQGITISGSVQGNPQTSGAVTLGQFYKVAFAYKENDFVLYINGVLQQSKTLGTLPTNLNSVYFCNSNGTEITDQRCRAAALYTTRLTNAELATLTTP